jgi:hypothetical protein
MIVYDQYTTIIKIAPNIISCGEKIQTVDFRCGNVKRVKHAESKQAQRFPCQLSGIASP